MPLLSGKSEAIFRANVKEGLGSFKNKGSFGSSGPISKDDARKRILAAAYAKQRESK